MVKLLQGVVDPESVEKQGKGYLVSGMQDRSVPILSTESMASELLVAGHDVTIRRIPTAAHNLVPQGGQWRDADPEYYRILDWFDAK